MFYHVVFRAARSSYASLFLQRAKLKFSKISKIFEMFNHPGFGGYFGGPPQGPSMPSLSSGLMTNPRMNRNCFVENMTNTPLHIRKVLCGELRMQDAGTGVEICGRLQDQRLGRFISLRDDTGITQLVVPDDRIDIQRRFKNMPLDSFLVLRGVVTARPEKSRNAKMPTGDVEVIIENFLSVHPKRKRDDADSEEDFKHYKRKGSSISASSKLTSEELGNCVTNSMIQRFSQRTHTCRELNKRLVGKSVTLCGWVSAKRVNRFVVLKDGYGFVQIVPANQNEDLSRQLQNLDLESVILVKGTVSRRPPGHENPRVENGQIEILVESVETIKPDDPLPQGQEGDDGDNDDHSKSGKENDKIMQVETSLEQIVPDPNKYTTRTHTCGELSLDHVGQNVRMFGWLEHSRLNKFMLLRDGYGKTQFLIPESRKDLQDIVKNASFESLILAEGIVCSRPPGQENTKQETGWIEVSVTDLQVLANSSEVPFLIRSHNKPKELLRLQHRYLDLRHPFMQRNLRTRSKIIHKIRRFLIEHLEFVEVETPTLFRRTLGGAQEFIVPTLNKDEFYALVQSPQQFKQLLMVGSVDRYFQIARCYRDEVTRNDRQPEFTQLDIEMSFCNQESILNLIEDLLKFCWLDDLPPIKTPFPRMTYNDAMNQYGTDKPDLRFDWKLVNLTGAFLEEKDNCKGKIDVNKFTDQGDFGAFAFVGRKGGVKLSAEAKKRMQQEATAEFPKASLYTFKIKDLEGIQETLRQLFNPAIALKLTEITSFNPDDALFLGLGPKEEVMGMLGKTRVNFADFLEENNIEVIEKNAFSFVWIIDFPLFVKKEEELESVHHPFTQPHPDDVPLLETEPLKVRSLHYDLVLNGNEIGGGSIRIREPDVQKLILEKLLKIDPSTLSHLLEALSFGAPPHGGIALGLDRLIAIMCNAQSIRDVIAFPKSGNGKDQMSGAPCEITKDDKIRYHIQ